MDAVGQRPSSADRVGLPPQKWCCSHWSVNSPWSGARKGSSGFICLLLTQVDISANNLLIGATDDTPFSQLERDEQARPVARKILPDRTIYMSRPVPQTNGQLILSDMGLARFGRETFAGDIMPDVYRASEVILGMEWFSKVDLWSVGVMVGFSPRHTVVVMIY